MKQFIICPSCGSIELAENIAYPHLCSCGAITNSDFFNPAKALSIKQPYAYLTASGICDIINKSQKTNFRGRVLIHAGAKLFTLKNDAEIFTSAQQRAIIKTDECEELTYRYTHVHPELAWPLSAIIGSVEIVDCVINHKSIWAERNEYASCNDLPCVESCEYFKLNKPVYNWVLANPILFEKPVPCKGKLSFFIPEIN